MLGGRTLRLGQARGPRAVGGQARCRGPRLGQAGGGRALRLGQARGPSAAVYKVTKYTKNCSL